MHFPKIEKKRQLFETRLVSGNFGEAIFLLATCCKVLYVFHLCKATPSRWSFVIDCSHQLACLQKLHEKTFCTAWPFDALSILPVATACYKVLSMPKKTRTLIAGHFLPDARNLREKKFENDFKTFHRENELLTESKSSPHSCENEMVQNF